MKTMSKERSCRGVRKAPERHRNEELYRLVAHYRRTRTIARRVPNFEQECAHLDAALAKALYYSVIGKYGA